MLRSTTLGALAAFLVSGSTIAQTPRPTTPADPRPLTLKEADALSDEELVRRALAQIAGKTMRVRRPSAGGDPVLHGMIPPRFTTLDLLLRPKPAEGVGGVCELEVLTLVFAPVHRPEAWPDIQRLEWRPSLLFADSDPAKLAAAADPPVSVEEIGSAKLYKIVGPVRTLDGVDPETAKACSSLADGQGFFGAPDAWSIWQATWLMARVAEAAKAQSPPFKLDCSGVESGCSALLVNLRQDQILGVGSCPEFDPKYVTIPPDSTCVSLRFMEDDRGNSFTSKEVNIIASTRYDGTTWTADVKRVLVSSRLTVID